MSLVASKLQLVPRPLDPGVVSDTFTHTYSTRRIRSGYTGPCLRVRRTSDNTEQDIGFYAGELNTASLLAFCGTSAGYVTTWYSQLSGVDNATQPVAEFQPRICANGVVDTLGTSSKAALFFANPERQVIPPNAYVATASSTYQSSVLYAPVVACDRSTSTAWVSDLTYTAAGAYTGAVSTTIDGTALLGEWFQVVLPNAVLVASLGIIPRSGALIQSPKQFTLAASADGGTTWTSLYRTTTGTYTTGVETRFSVNATKTYDTFRIVVDATTDVAAAFATFALYGADASPLPKEVNLVPFVTASTHGGYTISESSLYLGNFARNLFDVSTSSQWLSSESVYTSGTGVYVGTVTTTVSGVSYAGEWVQVTVPAPVVCRKLGLMSSTTYGLPKTFLFAGSNDNGATWTLLYRNTVAPTYTTNVESLFPIPGHPLAYTSFRLICEDIGTSGTSTRFNSLKLYGFEPPLTFLTVPSGAPQSLVGGVAPEYEQNLVPASGYTATASTEYNSNFIASRAFDRSQSTAWASANLTYTNGTGEAVYVGSVSTTVTGLGAVSGEWVQIQLPVAARLTRYAFYPRQFPGLDLTNRYPREFLVVGSNNGSTWEVVDQVTYSGFTYTNYKPTTFRPRSSTKSFSYYRAIIKTLFTNATLVDIAEWELFGIYDVPPAPQSLVPAMTAGNSHGWYTAAASSNLGASYDASYAFGRSGWISNTVYNNGAYTGAVTTVLDTGSVTGETLDIFLPYQVQIRSYQIKVRDGWSRNAPSTFTLAHSTTRGASWVRVERRTGLVAATWGGGVWVTFTPAAPITTSALRLIVEAINPLGTNAEINLVINGYEFPTFVTPAPRTTPALASATHAAVSLVPSSSLLSGTFLAAPPGSAVSEMLGVASPTPSSALQTYAQRVYAPTPANTNKLTRVQPTSTNAAYALDALSAPAKSSIGAAFSTRRLLANYRGPLLRIRRSSDNAEYDWHGNPDVLDTFLAGGATGYVAIWYDQSGLGKHATAPTAAEQPRLATNRGRYVVYFDGTGFASSRYLTFPVMSIRSLWSQFYVAQLSSGGSGYATVVGNTASAIVAENGIDFEGRNIWRNMLTATGSTAHLNATKYTYAGSAQNILPLQRWVGFLGVRGSGTNTVNTVGRHYRSDIGFSYRDFNGYMSDLVLFTAQLTSDADATVLYAARAINDTLSNTQSRGVVKASLYGSSSLIASLTDSAKRILVEGRLTRDSTDLVTLGSELARLGPNLAAPITSPTTLKLAGSTWAVPFDYVIKRGSIVISSGFSTDAFFTNVKDTRPAFVVIDGSLTIDANATFIPPTRKLFTVVYVSGDLTVNGSISMTARGANHSGTGDSGGYVAPQDILILNGTRDGVSSPKVPATGGAGAIGAAAGGTGNTGTFGASGGTGGGGAGGWGGGSAPVGNGTGGTSFTGGTGGGGSFTTTYIGAAGEQNGGLGGVNFNGQIYSGRGAGNPDNGTGGTLVIVVGGIVSGNGRVESRGSSASGGGTGGASSIGGGGSGGGSVTVLSTSGGELVDVTAAGGTRARTTSGLGGNGTARLLRTLSSPVISARVRDLSSLTNGAVVATWGSWTAAVGTEPTYVAAGTDGKPEIAFDRTLGHFMDAGTRTFNVGTNEGLTIMLYIKLPATYSSIEEYIFGVGPVSSSSGLHTINIIRSSSAGIRIIAGDASLPINFYSVAGMIATDTWFTVGLRYRRVNGNGITELFINNALNTQQDIGANTLANRTNARTYIGKATFNESYNWSGSMRFAAMWDRALTDNELTGLYTSLIA